MSERSNAPRDDAVMAFLSCSIRPEDRALVTALETKVLAPMGLCCLTVGRNVSLPEQVDDAIRDIIEQVDCLIGVATVRFDAVDRAVPNRTLAMASPYPLQESAMAHQRRLPFLIFKTPEVTLQGVTGRNLYIDVDSQLGPTGKPRFKCSRDVLTSSLADLKRRALEDRRGRSHDEFLAGLGKLSTLLVGTYAVKSAWEWLIRPKCFGTFYYQDPECQECSFKPSCKVEKARRNADGG